MRFVKDKTALKTANIEIFRGKAVLIVGTIKGSEAKVSVYPDDSLVFCCQEMTRAELDDWCERISHVAERFCGGILDFDEI